MRGRQRTGMSRILVALAVGSAVAACVGAPRAGNPEASSSPNASLATATAPTFTAVPSPSEFAPPTSLPAGPLTSIRWTKLTFPAPPPYPYTSDDPRLDHAVHVFGWSRGYVMLIDQMQEGNGVLTATKALSYSTDGIHWKPGRVFDKAGQSGQSSDIWSVEGVGMIEGPAGLMAVDGAAFLDSCTYPTTVEWAEAFSQDGVTWNPLELELGSIQDIGAGGAGYIAVGVSGAYTSTNGTTWQRAALTGPMSQGVDGIHEGVAFDGGFVIVGYRHGPAAEQEGCAAGPQLLDPSVWYSKDGGTWSRSQLPGALQGADVLVSVYPLASNVLIATEWNADYTEKLAWLSKDGITWTQVPYERYELGQALTCGEQNLILATDAEDRVTFFTLRQDLTVTEVRQTGEIPDLSSMPAPVLGPAGLLVTDGAETYIGVLSDD
jgi:hypothetical protein